MVMLVYSLLSPFLPIFKSSFLNRCATVHLERLPDPSQIEEFIYSFYFKKVQAKGYEMTGFHVAVEYLPFDIITILNEIIRIYNKYKSILTYQMTIEV